MCNLDFNINQTKCASSHTDYKIFEPQNKHHFFLCFPLKRTSGEISPASCPVLHGKLGLVKSLHAPHMNNGPSHFCCTSGAFEDVNDPAWGLLLVAGCEASPLAYVIKQTCGGATINVIKHVRPPLL